MTSQLRALLLGLLVGAPLAAQDAGPTPIDTRIRRCHPASGAVCVEVLGEVLERGSDSTQARQLRLGNATFVEDRAGGAGGSFKPAYLFVLMDVSGSMLSRGGGSAAITRFDGTRSALNAFLSKLAADRLPVRVAVAPFGSERVDETIGRATFRQPQQALSDLARIPSPSATANTALYSAVRAASRRLAKERGAKDIRALLLVVSDGRNDIGQDKTLLPNDSLGAAVRAMQEARVDPVLLGIGDNIPTAQLDSLAIGSAPPYLTTADAAGSIAAKLFQIRDDLQSPRLIFWTTEDISVLGRIVRNAGLVDPSRGLVLPVDWTPPLLALPAFEYPVDSAVAQAWAQGREIDSASGVGARLAYASLLVLLCAAGWLVLPRWLWPPIVLDRDVQRATTDFAAVSDQSSATGGLRRGVKEAPPRGPQVDTAEFPIVSS
jgi:hypothetical protein